MSCLGAGRGIPGWAAPASWLLVNKRRYYNPLPVPATTRQSAQFLTMHTCICADIFCHDIGRTAAISLTLHAVQRNLDDWTVWSFGYERAVVSALVRYTIVLNLVQDRATQTLSLQQRRPGGRASSSMLQLCRSNGAGGLYRAILAIVGPVLIHTTPPHSGRHLPNKLNCLSLPPHTSKQATPARKQALTRHSLQVTAASCLEDSNKHCSRDTLSSARSL